MILRLLGNLGGLAAGVLAALWVAGPPLAGPAVLSPGVVAVPVPLDPRDPARERVGRLRYLGGLELRAQDRRFGGISALLWEPECARLLAVTDTGAWIILAPEERAARLLGIAGAWMAPIRDEAGAPPRSKRAADAEALARLGGETIVVFEQDHRLQRYRGLSACVPESLGLPAHAVERPEAMRGWPDNGGAEAASAAGEALLLLSEEGASAGGLPDARDALLLVPGGGAERLGYRMPAGHAATGIDEVPGAPGRHVAVFRRFSPLAGVSVVVGELALPAGVGARQVLEVSELARLAPPLAVDNIEAVAVRREGDRLFLYLASDDNFSPVQRTLLLKFERLP